MPAKKTTKNPSEDHATTWTFLSNHAHVLLCIMCHGDIRLRDVATKVGITERAVQRIVADLEQGGYLSRSKNGRRNQYQLHVGHRLAHPLEAHRKLQDILALANLEAYQIGRTFEADGHARRSTAARKKR